MDQQKIGRFLRELRKEKHLTQEQLAEVLNVSGRTVSRWETGSNMPDISLLVELSDFYDVSIPEIIDGERKNKTMNREVHEVAEKMSDYAGAEKETMLRSIRHQSIAGACAVGVCFLLDITGLGAQNGASAAVYQYCETLVYVTTLMIMMYTTGLLDKGRRRFSSAWLSCMPKPVGVLVAALVALAGAAAVKLLLSMLPGR